MLRLYKAKIKHKENRIQLEQSKKLLDNIKQNRTMNKLFHSGEQSLKIE